MANSPERVSIPMSETVRARLQALSRAWQEAEGLTRAPTYDEVIRRLLAMAGEHARAKEGT